MEHITFVAAPGAGKSTTAADLFVQLKKLGKNAELVQEWIRRDIHRNGPIQNPFEQYRTLMHNQREGSDFPDSVEYVIHDGNTLIGYFYAAVYSQKTEPKERLVIQDLYASMLHDLYARKYDRIYFIPRAQTEIFANANNDGTRFQSKHDYEVLDTYMRLIFTEIHRMPNVKVLDCPLHKRMEFLLTDILGLDAILFWKAIADKEINGPSAGDGLSWLLGPEHLAPIAVSL